MTGRPPDVADRPDRACRGDCSRGLPMDALSDVLRAVRLTGAIFFDIHAAEPWVAETPRGASFVDRIFPGSGQLIPYHIVTEGSCWGWAFDEPPLHLDAGDIIMFPHGDPHVISSAPGM